MSQPALVGICLWRGKAGLQARDDAAALRWLLRGERFADHRGELEYELARVYRRLGHFDLAEIYLKRALRNRWDAAQVQRERWLAAVQNKQFDQVEGHWADLLSDPRDDGPEICNAYVTWCMLRLRPNNALSAIQAWERDYPADPQPRYLRGLIYEGTAEWTAAVDEFRRAVELSPGRTDASLHLAEDLFHLRRYEEAEGHYRCCVETDPSNVKAAVGSAKCLAKLGRADEAHGLMTAELQRHPDDLDVLQALGELELEAGRPAEARKYLEPVVRKRPERQPVRYALAQALQALGEMEAAKKQFAFIEESQKALLRLGAISQELSRKPDDTDLHYEWAVLTWKYKSHDEGVARLLSLLVQAPDHAQAHAALARHYALLGDERQAAYHRRRAEAVEAQRVP